MKVTGESEKKVYADSSLNISMGDFEPPIHGFEVEFDCEKYDTENINKNVEFDEDEEF